MFMGKKQSRTGAHFFFFFASMIISSVPIYGCSHLYEGFQAKSTFQEANDFFSRGSYRASLSKYEQIIEKYPSAGDRALFEIGIIYTHPANEQKDYEIALECFQKLIKDYPGSMHRQDAEMMVFYIHNVTIKDQKMVKQQTTIETLERKVKAKEDELFPQLEKIKALEQEIHSRGNGN